MERANGETAREFAPAKVNLTLNILGRRPDGWHALESLVAFAEIGDTLTVIARQSDQRCRTTGLSAGDLIGKNLVDVAAAAVNRANPQFTLPDVELDKTLPLASGLGGGSADAAAYLRLVQRLNPDLEGSIDWMGVAASISADVPVCFANRPAMMWGTGDKIVPIPWDGGLAAVLVNPRCAVPATKTADVFRDLAAPIIDAATASRDPEPPATFDSVLDMIRSGRNDMELAASRVMPDILQVRDALERTGDVSVVRLSGAGPTMFGLYPTPDASRAAAETIRDARPDWWVHNVQLGCPSHPKR